MATGLEAALAALERDPDDAGAHRAAARAYLADGSTVAAAAHLAQADRLGLEAVDDWIAVGRAHRFAGEARAAAAAFDRAVVGRPGDAALRQETAEAWVAWLRTGGAAPRPKGRVLSARRAEVAIFGLACASWDLVGSCLAHFVARWLADAVAETAAVATVLPGGRSRRRRAHPAPPDRPLLDAVADRTGATRAVYGDLVLEAGAEPGIHLRIDQAIDGGPDPDFRAPFTEGRIAAATTDVLRRALERLVPPDAATAARADLDALAGLSDAAFLDLVVLAELGARGRTDLARRVAAAAGPVAFAAAVVHRAADDLAGADPEAASDLAEALHRARPDDLEAALLFGRLGSAAGRAGATGLLSRVAREGDGPLSAAAHVERARLHAAAGRPDLAAEALESAIARDPTHGPARVALAERCRADGDLDGAIGHLTAGVPSLSTAAREAEIDAISEALLAADRPDALLALAAAATADGTNTPLLAAAYAAGAVRADSDRVRRALVLLEPHVGKDLDEETSAGIRSLYVESCCRVAAASRAIGDLLDAERRHRRALDVDPESASARLGLGGLLLELGRPDEAYAVLQDAPACPGALPHAWILLARALLALGRTEDARTAAERAGEAARDHPDLAGLVD